MVRREIVKRSKMLTFRSKSQVMTGKRTLITVSAYLKMARKPGAWSPFKHTECTAKSDMERKLTPLFQLLFNGSSKSFITEKKV